MKRILLLLASMLSVPMMAQTTWHVSSSIGGPRYTTANPSYLTAATCSGLGTTPYNPSGAANQSCPYSMPIMLWNDGWTYNNASWVMAGGDTASIDCASSAPCQFSGYPTTAVQGDPCWGIGPYCAPPTMPSGTSGAHTRILGINDGACEISGQIAPDPTKTAYLIASGGSFYGISLVSSQYVDFQCIDITGQGTQSGYGIYTGTVAGNAYVSLTDMNIHGFSSRGIRGNVGGLWTVDHVEIAFNGQAGWDFDPGSGELSNGSVNAAYLGIDWNGCLQEYPITHAIPVANGGCHDDGSSGYGDGIGTPVTNNLSFSCNYCRGTYNTQDGYDLGHTVNSTISITNSYFAGNMGGNIKVGPDATVTVENNLIVGNCYRMHDPIIGAQTGFNSNLGDFCRASGDQNGLNPLTNAELVGNATTTGMAVVGSGTNFTTQLSSGNSLGFANQNAVTYNRTIASIADDTHLTLTSAFPTDQSGQMMLIPGGVASSSSVLNVYFNTDVGYGATVWDNQCQFGLFAGGGVGQNVADPSYCTGYTLNFEDNATLGYSDQVNLPGQYNSGVVPAMWTTFAPTNADYNLYYGLTSSYCTGAHDVCMNPLFTSQPSLTVTAESQMDNFNFYPAGGSPLIHSGTAIGGISTDYYGVMRPNPPSIGAVEPAGTPTAATPTFSPVAGAYTGTQSVTTSTTTSACSAYLYTGTPNPPTANTNAATVVTSSTIYSYVHGCPGYLDSAVGSAAYTITTPSGAAVTSGNITFSGNVIIQ